MVRGTDLNTEGEYLRENDFPIVEFKAPYRDYSVNNLVKKVLERYNIDRYHITIPNLEVEDSAVFTRIARPGYEIEASRKNADGDLINVDYWHWDGAVTDFAFDPKGVDYLPPNGAVGLCEYQGNLYSIDGASTLYRIDPETRTYQNLGVIDLGPGRKAGLASANDRLFALTRWEIYEIHLGDVITTTKINITGVGVDSRGLTPHRGHAVGLTSRNGELFIGYRQGLTRLELDGNNARNIDLPVNSYRDIISDLTVGASTDNLAYFNGRFYFTGRSIGSGFNRDTLYSFAMADDYTTSDGSITLMAEISAQVMGTYRGQLVTANIGNKKLIYINSENNAREELDNPTFYFLYSARDQNSFPHLLQYEVLSDTWTIVYRHAQHAEFWNMATKDFKTFYILGNESPLPIGDRPDVSAYNAMPESVGRPNTNKIWKYDRTTNAFTTMVDSSNAFRPQLAQYYHLGFEGSQNRFGFLPDTRKGIMLDPDLDDLYYIYSIEDAVGVARLARDGSTETIMRANVDNWHNECGIDFTVANNTIYMSSTFINNTDSTLKIDAYSLGQAPRISRSISDRLTEGVAYDQSVRAVGDPVPTVTSSVTSGTLPSGLTLDGARLHGTPTSIPDGGSTFSVTFIATNERGTHELVVDFRVKDENAIAPVFGSFTETELIEGTSYDETITASGTPSPTITSVLFSGTLPTGMTLDGARLHGAPRDIPNDGVTFLITFTATNSEGTASETITFNARDVNAPIFGTFADQTLTEGTAYDETITATGTPSPTITSSVTSGTLPTGLTLANARLHGTPTGIADAGVRFSITFSAMNTITTTTKVVNYRVKDENAAIPSFSSFTATTLTEGTAYNETIGVTGSPTPTVFSRVSTGRLPTGMILNGAQLSGTPTNIPDAGSTFTIIFTATNSEGATSQAVNFTVANTP